MLVQIREVVAPSAPSAASRVFVPNRASVRYIYPFAVEAGEDVGDLLNPFAVEAGETVEDLLEEGNSGYFDELKAASTASSGPSASRSAS